MSAVEDKKWSNLITEILKIINSKIKDQNSKIVFRLTCKNWGSSVEPPYINLHPLLPMTFAFSEINYFPRCRLVPTAVYLLRSHPPYKSDWWLVSVEQSNPDTLRAFHPLTGKVIPYELIKDIRPNLEFIELSKGCNLRNLDGFSPVFMEKPVQFYISKVILWRNPQGGDDHFLVRLYNQSTLEFVRVPTSDIQGVYCGTRCKVGVSLKDTKGNPRPTRVHDVELCNGVIWVIDSDGNLYKVAYESFEVTAVTVNGVFASSCRSKRLVVSRNDDDDESEDLYMVVCNTNCDEFTIYMLDSGKNEWVKVESLNDKILFVGYQTCFFCSSRILKKIKGGSIIFPIDLYPCYTDSSSNSLVSIPPEYLDEYRNQNLDQVKDYLQMSMSRYAKGPNAYNLMIPTDHITPLFWPPPLRIFKSEPGQETNAGSSSDDSLSSSGAEALQVLGFEESPVPGFEDEPHIAYGMKGMQSSDDTE